MVIKSHKLNFPIFRYQPNLIYLDSTATSLKPKSVIYKLVEYYEQYSANVFRGVYKISEKATEEYEETRKEVAKFINAKRIEEVVFTRSATESINLVAYSLGRKIVDSKDEIVTTIMEHHSNFVPWQVLAGEVGATFKLIDINKEGYLDLYDYNVKTQKSNVKSTSKILNLKKLKQIITHKTKIFALTYVSNVLGTINPIKEIVKVVKTINPKVIIIVDAAQAVPHMKVDVQDLGCDFLAFSSHKMLGPTGVGVLWGKYELLDDMFPFNFGGEMIQEVYVDKTVFKDPPHRFEAGTPHIAGVIALKEAVRYLQTIGLGKVREHEKNLLTYVFKKLKDVFGDKIKIFGPENIEERGGIVTFSFENFHPHDVAQILDEKNICIRAGHHCAMPLHHRFGLNASCRVSFYIYNSEEDIDQLVDGLKRVKKILG